MSEERANGDSLRRLVGGIEARQNARAGLIAARFGVLRDRPDMPTECAAALDRSIAHLREFTQITANAETQRPMKPQEGRGE